MAGLSDFLPVALGAAAGGPAGAAAAAGQSGVLGGALGGTGTAGPMDFGPTAPINVAPVGVNLGEIIKGYEQGGATNGGSGSRPPSRYSMYTGANGGQPALSIGSNNGPSPWLIYGAVGGGILLVGLFLTRKKGA